MNNNSCNNNDGYERALRIIQEANRNRPILYGCCNPTTGPTGPTGPAGPATIAVGTTTTGEAGTESSVTNSGTSENVILDFVIPAGSTGPTGATGPAGETPTLTIGTVTTGNPGTEASATITGTAPNFVLNLTIPQGPTGATAPMGPMGPTGPMGPMGPTGPTGPAGPVG